MSLLSLLSSWSCAHPSDTENAPKSAHIVSFHYSYDGTIGGNSHHYILKVTDSVATVTVRDLMHQDYGDMTDVVDAAFVQALEKLCAKHNVKRWDGFDKYNRLVSDGHGFTLSIEYDDDKSVYAHGMNMSPKGFWDFDEELHELFAPVCERLLAKGLQQKIAEGVSGELRFIMLNFIQKGTSGSDSYKVQVCRQSIRETNFQVRIHSVSGEFFPKGKYAYYAAVPDEAVDWKAFAKLVNKHRLTRWMDYEKSAEDYNNCEWFQLAWSFENGHIHAMGTEHPDGYNAFRKDFLKLLKKTVEQATEKYQVKNDL